ncbi:P-loop containing nucleoside triphosphate hydrolase protein [Russula ochroleuca]|jgi:CCR4-NOT complex subunit CAF16|uniref:P-loop containing nucleoside triphosphate hydrolase protein n=1 Tax=Russula ochroleuca TaxID=152965 RepID=A0A9P5N1Y6_9AGAM|nr:P-loop containing nucleoside triphosphate hydrolase protein [Russula ochroleuca]
MAGSTEILVQNLTYSHDPSAPASLSDINISLPKGSRTLLIGANGAGKSTLLQILAGKRLVTSEGARILIKGCDVFRHSPPGITYLGTEWAMNPVVRGDIRVEDFLNSVGGYRHKERRDRLLDILDVDLDWHMHAISDGERRRVQLCMGLMQPWDVLLLDEVTVDLDVQVRDDLLSFLKEDSQHRNATILYATHIFDGLNEFPTHVTHMRLGSFVINATPWPLPPIDPLLDNNESAPDPTLFQIALQWLREDRVHRQELEKGGRKTRGARRDQAVPSSSEAFYKKYDYSH